MAGTRRDHQRCEGADHQVGTAQVGIENEIPLVGGYFVQELPVNPDPSVVHQDVAPLMEK